MLIFCPLPWSFPVTFISSASLSYFFPLPRSPCHPSLPGARFPSHLKSVSAVVQSLALPGAREKSPPGVPTCIPALCVAYPLFQVRDFPRTWSPFPLSVSHFRFQVRRKSHTSESHPASQPSVWPFRSLRCAISLAPGTRNGSCSMICGSRCELAVEYLDGSLICLYLADGKGMEFRP